MGDAYAQALSDCAGSSCPLAHEKAASRNMYPDVLAQVESMDVGNKQNLSEKKANPISIKRQN